MATVYYKREEIAKNNGKDGARTWIIVRNIVYDVTGYLKKDEHPGGNDLIDEWAGKDASRAFDDAGHSGDAKSDLKKYRIGELAEEDRNVKKSAANGKAANGKAANGTAQNGNVANGTVQNGKALNGTAQNGKTENGKVPQIVPDYSERNGRSCLSIITCGLIA